MFAGLMFYTLRLTLFFMVYLAGLFRTVVFKLAWKTVPPKIGIKYQWSLQAFQGIIIFILSMRQEKDIAQLVHSIILFNILMELCLSLFICWMGGIAYIVKFQLP